MKIKARRLVYPNPGRMRRIRNSALATVLQLAEDKVTEKAYRAKSVVGYRAELKKMVEDDGFWKALNELHKAAKTLIGCVDILKRRQRNEKAS